MSSSEQLGWIGLGSMGIGMSMNLQKHLSSTGAPSLIYTNRTLSRGKDLQALGAIPVETVAEVTTKSSIIFSCVSNDQVLNEVADAIIAVGVKGKIYIDCSTVHPDTSVAVSKKITEAGGLFVASPVFGAAPMAAAGKLIFVVAGPAEATKKTSPYIKDIMGRSVIDMGEDVSKSSMLKIAGNICVVSFMEVLSEAHVFAEKVGLGSAIFETMVADMFGPVLESYSKRLTTGIYAPEPGGKAGFDVELSMKDARHALNCAKTAGTRLEVSEVALKHMEQARALLPDRALDSSSMYGTIRKEAGLDFYTDLCKERDSKVSK
ncbi:6-phosphogluconate dehydrogenase family protein [Grosmannia clavigera kw1407]|uniref:6-phosphogluconate dehydrogenase family protein n=1 Tax=Grosmannia clavigera (strain kw1407 / UAMH 11150) TaxID=655863 RepID=F0XH42_GROCL|nr:6-phosphogluconate dehydrogenase family protein [Grosmannia clavigera kw1407]EFX03112.1 6-phosphogluconate dehydrogenase family protein [Grosmannia clavigera kw1407]